MGKTFFAVLMAAALFGFAVEFNDTPPEAFSSKMRSSLPLQDMSVARQGFYYVRFAAAESDLIHAGSIRPGLGFGYRRLAGDGAADISVSGIGHAERRNGQFLWTFPKASYIHYLQPDATKSAYIGGGLAWGGVDSRDRDFIGIIPSVTWGYEFIRKTSFLGFSELTISQPAISVYRTGSFPGPCAEFSTGVGF